MNAESIGWQQAHSKFKRQRLSDDFKADIIAKRLLWPPSMVMEGVCLRHKTMNLLKKVTDPLMK